jgi:hypothetical protein
MAYKISSLEKKRFEEMEKDAYRKMDKERLVEMAFQYGKLVRQLEGKKKQKAVTMFEYEVGEDKVNPFEDKQNHFGV